MIQKNSHEWLLELGWPSDKLGELGVCRWSAMSGDEGVKASLTRKQNRIIASIDEVSIEGGCNLMQFKMECDETQGSWSIKTSTYGSPPEELSFEETKAIFLHMIKGMRGFKFISSGPVRIESKVGGLAIRNSESKSKY